MHQTLCDPRKKGSHETEDDGDEGECTQFVIWFSLMDNLGKMLKDWREKNGFQGKCDNFFVLFCIKGITCFFPSFYNCFLQIQQHILNGFHKSFLNFEIHHCFSPNRVYSSC